VNYRLGKLPPVYDSRTLRFGHYLEPHLPAPPPTVDYGANVKKWPMYDNDRFGDCTCAAAGHMIQCWTAVAGKARTPTNASVLKFYEHFVGTPPPPDQGCNMRDVLTYWRHTGLAKDKITAFVSLEPKNQTQAQDALYMFGSIYIGVALPDSVCHGDLLENPWVVPPQGPIGDAAPDPNNGHCICAVGYDSRNLYVVTWGEIKAMSWPFYAAYADEAYAVLSTDFIARDGETTAGFDLTALEKDLDQISNIPSTAVRYTRR
jgi:hypothetical protein